MVLGQSYLFWITFALLGLLFFFFPGVDIWFSSLFFGNGEFFLKDHALILFIYDVTHPIIALFFLGSLGLLIYTSITKKILFSLKKQALLFILISIIMAPGVVVNLTLKDNVDRARPKQVTQFGGDKQFTPAFVVSDQCDKNCSFVCGHAAAGFSFIALALVYTGKIRRRIFIAAVTAGFLIGLVRVIQGGHFLSDVFFSFFFTYLTIRLLYYLIIGRLTTAYEKVY